MNGSIPRRANIDKCTLPEVAIMLAISEVEVMGADVRLTDAVVLLQAARESVADYIDGIDNRRFVATPTQERKPK